MHELSLAWEVIGLTEREAAAHGVNAISELEIEVGDLSGVDAGAFGSALELITPNTILEGSVIRINRTPGMGFCPECQTRFPVRHRMEACPGCGGYPSEIEGGREFRVVSMLTG